MTDEPLSPSGENGSPVRCLRCGAETPAGNQCVACGAFLPANAAALKHGLRRYETTGVLPPDLKQSVEEFRAGVVSDQGGLDDLSAVRAGLCRLLVDAEVGRRLTMNEVIKQGLATRGGRAAYDRLLSTMDRWLRISSALGLERRQKQINPLDAVRQAVEEANRS